MKCECKKCGLQWESVVDPPKVCPKSKNYDWREPRKRGKRKGDA